MNNLRKLGVAVALSSLAACGGGEDQTEANATELNVAVDSENVDAGLNVADPAANTLDGGANLSADVNASGNLSNDSVALNATNTAE